MKQAKKGSGTDERPIDQRVSSANRNLKSKFVLIPSVQIKSWKAFVIVMFVAGFFAAVIWGAYDGWYVSSGAKSKSEIDKKLSEWGFEQPAKKEKGCLKAGRRVPGPNAKNAKKSAKKCCTGLKEIDAAVMYSLKKGCSYPDPIKKTNSSTSATANKPMICSACGNGACEDQWENPCNCPTDCPKNKSESGAADDPSCVVAGGVVRVSASGAKLNKCCSGLIEIKSGVFPQTEGSKKCVTTANTGTICSACGNGTCDSWENRCSCSVDCQ